MLTKDDNIIDMQFAVQYRVGQPEAYLFNNVRPDDIVLQQKCALIITISCS